MPLPWKCTPVADHDMLSAVVCFSSSVEATFLRTFLHYILSETDCMRDTHYCFFTCLFETTKLDKLLALWYDELLKACADMELH